MLGREEGIHDEEGYKGCGKDGDGKDGGFATSPAEGLPLMEKQSRHVLWQKTLHRKNGMFWTKLK